MKRIIILSVVFLLWFTDSSRAFTLSGFESPECIQVDADTGAYYVSNLPDGPRSREGTGYISKITANGNTVIQKFIGGKPENPLLDAPKGLWITSREIFVADIDAVKIFDKETGKPTATINLASWQVRDLNDLAMDSLGTLYGCDKVTNRIFKIDLNKNNEVSVFKEGTELGGPNGLMVNPKSKHLMVSAWDRGEILEIELNGKVHVLKRGLKGLDGIDYDVDGSLYVSSFEKGEIYRIPFYGRGSISTFMSGLMTPANISCDRKKSELLVPSSKGYSVSSFALQPKKAERTANFSNSEEKKPNKTKNWK